MIDLDKRIHTKSYPLIVLGDDGEIAPDKPKLGEPGQICSYCGFISHLDTDYCWKCNRRLDAIPPDYRWAKVPIFFLLLSFVCLFIENNILAGIIFGVIAIIGFIVVIKWMQSVDENAY